MQTISERQYSTERAPSPVAGDTVNAGRVNRRSKSNRPACTCSNHPGSSKCSRHGYLVPKETSKRSNGCKEVIRRALTPANRRFSLRWLNFQPAPSRLSNMSMA